MFILEPKIGDWERLQGLIERQQERAKDLPYPHFDRFDGWGHNFKKEHDRWEGIKENGTKWDFHASHSDQGLLYYWTKVFKQDVSIVIGAKIQNWVPDTNTGLPKLLTQMLDEPLKKFSAPAPLATLYGCDHEKTKRNTDFLHVCRVPYRDFAHFMGRRKPWQGGYNSSAPTDYQHLGGGKKIWFQELIEINTKHSMGIDFKAWEASEHLKGMKESPLGYKAMYKDHAKKMMGISKTSVHMNMTYVDSDSSTLLYENPPDMSLFPEWIQNYVSWHEQMRRDFPGMKLFEDPKAPKLLVRTCLGLCGGLHDRLGQLPWDLYLANQTNRVLLLAWQRPQSLEEFLVPHGNDNPLTSILDWSIPKEALFGFADIRRVRDDYTELFQGYSEDRPEEDFWKMHIDEALERANTGKFQNVQVLRHRILGHLGEDYLERRLVALGETPQNVSQIHTGALFGNIFWLFFKASPAIDQEFRAISQHLALRPQQYSAVHCRVRHPKATLSGVYVVGKNPKYPADKTGLPWEGATRQFALDVATRALSCAMNITPDPLYFLSDSNDLVRHVAFELNDENHFLTTIANTNSSNTIDPSLQYVVQHSHGGVVSRDVSEENAHIDRQKGRPASAYYGTFLDLLVAVHARCVIFGIGYYASFAAKISGTKCKLLYQAEEWGKSRSDKRAQVCTEAMWYHNST